MPKCSDRESLLVLVKKMLVRRISLARTRQIMNIRDEDNGFIDIRLSKLYENLKHARYICPGIKKIDANIIISRFYILLNNLSDRCFKQEFRISRI